MKRQCEYCGTEYVARQADQRFCNTTCGQHWWRDERRRGIELIRSQTYYGMTLVEAAENQGRYAAVGAEQLSPLPAPGWSRDPTGTEPPIEGDGDRLGLALGGGAND
jgi:hypothetical protein